MKKRERERDCHMTYHPKQRDRLANLVALHETKDFSRRPHQVCVFNPHLDKPSVVPQRHVALQFAGTFFEKFEGFVGAAGVGVSYPFEVPNVRFQQDHVVPSRGCGVDGRFMPLLGGGEGVFVFVGGRKCGIQTFRRSTSFDRKDVFFASFPRWFRRCGIRHD